MSILLNIKEISSAVRFSILSNKKIQISYKVPIVFNSIVIDELKVKIRYSKIDEKWVIIPFRIKFLNNLSMFYGIKRSNILIKFEKVNIDINLNSLEYKITNIVKEISLNDVSWYRNFQLKKLLCNLLLFIFVL
jgi:hypothetical protein